MRIGSRFVLALALGLSAACGDGTPAPAGVVKLLGVSGRSEGAGVGAGWHEETHDLISASERLASPVMLRLDGTSVLLSDARPSLRMRPGDPAVTLDIPELPSVEGLALRFSYRAQLEGVGGKYFPVHLVVMVEDGDGDMVTLWPNLLVLAPPDGGPWRTASLPLDGLAGRPGRVRFSVGPGPGAPPEFPEDLVCAFGAIRVVGPPDPRPSLLLVTIDTLRQDHLSPWGADPALTPAAERLARSGVVVERAWSTSPWTLPAYASLLTGEYPSTHGAERDFEVEADVTRRLSSGVPSLVEHLSARGYTTVALFNNAHLRLGSGLEAGFDRYVHYAMNGEHGVRLLRQTLAELRGRPFFLFFHLGDVHSPYVPPRRYQPPDPLADGLPEIRHVPSLNTDAPDLFRDGVPEAERDDFRELYRLMVSYADERVDEVLDALEASGRRDDTLVVLHADHGEELWDHGGWYHGHTEHTELAAIPLVYSFPGVLPAGRRVAGDLRGVDVLPTALDLLDLWDAELDVEGRSFAHLLTGEDGPAPPPALTESRLKGPREAYALTSGRWRLFVDADGTARLFDLDTDPTEQDDLAAREPERVREMLDAGRRLRERALSRRAGESERMPIDEEAARHLRLLGYAGTATR